MAARKPNAAQVLSQALVTALEQARTAGCDAYPVSLKELTAKHGLKVSPAVIKKATAEEPFASRALLAAPDPAAPAALRDDLDRLASCPPLLAYALAKVCKAKIYTCPPDQLAEKAQVDSSLAAAFTAALRHQVESGTLPPVAGSTTVDGQTALYLANRPPPAPKPEIALAEKLLKVLANLRPDPASYPLTVSRLVELTDDKAPAAVVAKALGQKSVKAATVVFRAKDAGAWIIAAGDEERLLRSPQLLQALLETAKISEHQAVAVADAGKPLPPALKKKFTEALTRDFDARALPGGLGWLTHKSTKLLYRLTPVPPPPPLPPPPPVNLDAAFEDAFARLNRERGSHNLVSLLDLRRAVPAPRPDFDAALDRLRRAGRFSLSAAEGRHGITPEERDAALVEDGSLLLYVSRRLS